MDARLEKNRAMMAGVGNVTPATARQLQAKDHALRARLVQSHRLLELSLAPSALAVADRAMMVRQLVTSVLIR